MSDAVTIHGVTIHGVTIHGVTIHWREPRFWSLRRRIWCRLAPLLRGWPRCVSAAIARMFCPRLTGTVTASYPIGTQPAQFEVVGRIARVTGDGRAWVAFGS